MPSVELNFTARVTSGCLVITPQGSLSLARIELMAQDALSKLQQGDVNAVIVDLAGVPIIDGVEYHALHKILTMGALMGAKRMMVGIHPGIASSLVEMDIDMTGVVYAHTVDDALKMMS